MMKPIRNHTLMAACLIIAAYMILDGFTFMLNPFSGRFSTFACKTTNQTGTLCTVTIYGLREIYRKSFTPDEFYRAVVIRTEPGVSGKESYGLTIQTLNEKINYIHHINPPGGMEQKASQINSLFEDGAHVPDTLMAHLGLDSSIYRRIFFILLAFGLAWYTSRIEFSSCWTVSPLKVQRGRFKTLVYSWLGADFLVRFGFILMIAFIFGCSYYNYSIYLDDFVSACRGVFLREPQLSHFPWGYLICLYPLIIILVMQALLHRQLLARLNINLSAWWVAAPLLAAPVLPLITPHLICDDCWELKYLMVGLIQDYEAPINTALAYYFLLIGLIQWLVVRKELSRSIVWVVMPLINSMLVILVYPVIYDQLKPGILVALIPLAIIIGMLIPALTMSWLVNRKDYAPYSGA